MIRIAIIEDNKSMRDKLRTAFNTSEKFECDIAASSVEQFLKYQKKLAPADFILLDIELPDGMSGIQGIPYLLKACPTTQIVMLTIHNNYDYVFNAICAGAMGYLMKDLSFLGIRISSFKNERNRWCATFATDCKKNSTIF